MIKDNEQWTRISIFTYITNVLLVKASVIYPITDEAYKEFCVKVFYHPGGEALRLSKEGVKILEKYHTAHTIDMVEFQKTGNNTFNMPSKHFVFLSRFCRKPYYIGMKKIIFFDEEEAFLFKLCDGDIDNVKAVAPEKLK